MRSIPPAQKGGVFPEDLLVAVPVLDDEIDPLEKVDVTKNVSLDRDDVGEFAFADGALVLIYLHHHRRPIGCGADRSHRLDSELVHPGIDFVPGRAAVEFHRDTAVGPNEQDDA